jgi:starch phosphorylase
MSEAPMRVDYYAALRELALDLRWSWNHASDVLWRTLDPEMWETTRNPWVILQTAAHDRIARLFGNPALARTVEDLLTEKRRLDSAPAWFQERHPNTPLRTAAYFSMEFMLTEALPIYSGGLGNVAGDQLKAASDLGVPVVGVGLLYAQGYFRQAIRPDGSQEALNPANDTGQLPIQPLRRATGDLL